MREHRRREHREIVPESMMQGVWKSAGLLILGTVLLTGMAHAQRLDLALPTDNDALLQGDGPGFYMYTDRIFEGVRSRPWEGGRYGFVRNEERTPAGIVFTRFHEGVDIRPVRRDARGEPLDDVRAVDEGRVVYVNTNPRASAYGIYVVVEHHWQGAPYYTLYAHLARASVREGAQVGRGERVGRLGYTGTGINQRRAHLHFEINLFLSDRFGAWMAEAHPRTRNTHGPFHGLNLAGIDVPSLYLALQEDPDVLIGDVVQQEAPAWKVLVPGGFIPELVERYPWLAGGTVPAIPPAAWLVHVGDSGLPLRFEEAERRVTHPVVVHVADRVKYGYESTNRMLARNGDAFELTEKGAQHLRLITMAAPSIGTPSRVAW